MTQDAERGDGLLVKEQGTWFSANVGKADDPKIMKLKVVPADFEDINRINQRIVDLTTKTEKGKPLDSDAFAKEVTGALAKFIVDWNLVDDHGKIECNDENKRRQLARFFNAFVVDDDAEKEQEDVDPVQAAPGKAKPRPTVLSKLLEYLGNYSNFLEA